MGDRSKLELQYEVGSERVTRGQFRLLLLLMLIQVVMTAQSNYAPGIVASMKSAWAEHKQDVAKRAAIRKTLASDRVAGTYSQPPTRVVWEEDPDRAAGLLAAGGYHPVALGDSGSAFLTQSVPPGAFVDVPSSVPECVSIENLNSTLAFMHELRAANQPPRLVTVVINGTMVAYQPSGNRQPEESIDAAVAKARTLSARSYSPTAEGGVLTADGPAPTVLSLQPGESGILMPAHWTPAQSPENPGTFKIQYREQLRLFFGQTDPNDSSHFTLNYDLDGKAGVIDGWLKPNGAVVLEPREGKRVGTTWYPHAK